MFALFVRQGAQFGAVTLAANAILLKFFMVAGYYLDGFANAAEQLAGRAIGAHHRPAFDRSVRLNVLWGTGLAALTSAFFLLFGEAVVDLMTTEEAVRAEARHYILWAAMTALAGVLAFHHRAQEGPAQEIDARETQPAELGGQPAPQRRPPRPTIEGRPRQSDRVEPTPSRVLEKNHR